MQKNIDVIGQLWKILPNMTLVNKANSTNWQFQKNKWILPLEETEHAIQDQSSGKVLVLKRKRNGSINSKKKVILQDRNDTLSDKWYRSKQDSEGWFTLENKDFGGLLTAEKPKKTRVSGKQELLH